MESAANLRKESSNDCKAARGLELLDANDENMVEMLLTELVGSVLRGSLGRVLGEAASVIAEFDGLTLYPVRLNRWSRFGISLSNLPVAICRGLVPSNFCASYCTVLAAAQAPLLVATSCRAALCKRQLTLSTGIHQCGGNGREGGG